MRVDAAVESKRDAVPDGIGPNRADTRARDPGGYEHAPARCQDEHIETVTRRETCGGFDEAAVLGQIEDGQCRSRPETGLEEGVAIPGHDSRRAAAVGQNTGTHWSFGAR